MSNSPISGHLIGIALAIGFLPASVPAQATAMARGLSPDEARAEFEAVCRDLRSGENEYYGEAMLRALEPRVQAGGSTLESIGLRGALSLEYLKFGRFSEAAELLTAAIEQGTAAGLDRDRLSQLVWSLGIAHLQAAEAENCLENHAAASCIVPVQPEAVHRLAGHTHAAARAMNLFLANNPQHVHTAWLLNLARMVSGDWPEGVPEPYRLPPDAFAPESDFAPWRDVAMEVGLDAVEIAGGAVMDDFDGDGRLDLVTSTADPCGSLQAYRNDGEGGFENVTVRWGLDTQLGGLNLVHADYDGDGRLDLLVLRGAWLRDEGRIRNSLLRNELTADGGSFVDVTHASGLAAPAYPILSAGWADYDLDGDLDLYLANEGTSQTVAFPSQLFRNNGADANGVVTFTDVAARAGVQNNRVGKAVAWGDYDDDGDPDLYVSGLGPNRLYRNEGPGDDGEVRFTDVAPALGVTEPSERSFASWFFDYDNDADLDLFVADYTAMTAVVAASYFGAPGGRSEPHLYRNDGGRFSEIGQQIGLTRPAPVMGANYGDLDNDGRLDVYLGTGDPKYGSLVPNQMYRGTAGGNFEEITMAGGFGHLQKGHGVAFGDLDGDGDQDLFHQLGGFYPGDAYGNVLFENPGSNASWVTLRLRGTRSNRYGLGARIGLRLETPSGERWVHILAGTGGSFGGSSFQQEIGLGDATRIAEIVVRWPIGQTAPQRFVDLAPNQTYELVEGETSARAVTSPHISLRGPGHPGH